MAEPTEAVPANAPWLQGWKTVAKASGEYTAPEKAQEGPVAAVKRVVKPWLMEWGLIAKETPAAPSKVFSQPSTVDVSTEVKMKKAVYIAPSEVQPDTKSLASNLSDVDDEIARAKKIGNKVGLDALIDIRNNIKKAM